MRYYVIGQDGSKYGPADLAALNQWIVEGRLQAWMYLEGEDGGRIVASSMPGLNFLPQAPPTGGQAPFSQAPSAPGQPVNPYEGYYYRPGFAGDQAYNPALFPKFHWGGFVLSWIWGLNHKQPITLISLGLSIATGVVDGTSSGSMFGGSSPLSWMLSLGHLGVLIWIGLNGYKWAWESGRFSSVEECRRCQTTWGWWGLAFFILCCGTQVLAAVAISGIS